MADAQADIKTVLSSLAANASAPERTEAGPGSVPPSVSDTPQNPLIPVPMKPDECKVWWDRVRRSRTRRDNRSKKWEILLKAYQPIVTGAGEAEAVRYNGHFRNVHTKLGQLFYQTPTLILTNKSPSPADQEMPNPAQLPGQPPQPPLKMEDVVAVKQAVLDDKLGPDGINAERLVDEILFDILAWSGVGFCKVGYLCTQKTVQTPVMQPDPSFIAPPPPTGSILGLGQTPQAPMVPTMGPDGQPMTQPVTTTVHQEWFARRLSPKKGLLPDDLMSTRYDEEATWKGMEFFMAPEKAKKLFGLTDEETNKAATDDMHAEYEDDKSGDKGTAVGLVHGVEIFCKSNVFTDEVHPLAFHQLILIEGKEDAPVVWRPCTDQSFDEKGRLTQDSIDKNPIRTWAIRDLADSPYPEADSAFTNSNIKAIGTWRRQSVQIRDAAIGKILYDLDAFDTDDTDQLKNAEIGAYIGVKAGSLNAGVDKILAQTAKVTNTPDDYRNAQLLKNDMDEVIGIPPSASGMQSDTVHSATENQNATAGFTGRNKKEQSRVIGDYVAMVRMIDQLIMRYATEDDYTLITGPNGAKTVQLWNAKMVSGRYLYEVAPDSQLSPDNAQDFNMDMRLYNLAAKDPLFNREYWLRRMARRRGADPNKVVLPPPPPQPPKPDNPSISITASFKDLAEGIMSGDPQVLQLAELMVLILSKSTQTPDPFPIPSAEPVQPPHGGSGETVDQHEASNSGGKPNAPGAQNFRSQPQ